MNDGQNNCPSYFTQTEEETEPETDTASCSGPCDNTYNNTCNGDALCVCDENQLVLLDCLDICIEGGYGGYAECSEATAGGYDVCYCSDEPGAFCRGYTGSDGCCADDNPCNLESNSQCDCDSRCGWDAADCQLDPGDCMTPYLIPSVPFEITRSTDGAGSNLGTEGCEGYGGQLLGSASGNEHVYQIVITDGQSLSFSLDGDFDAVLSVRYPCGDQPSSCVATDDGISSAEVMDLSFTGNGYWFVVVDGYSSFDHGGYTLSVTDITR